MRANLRRRLHDSGSYVLLAVGGIIVAAVSLRAIRGEPLRLDEAVMSVLPIAMGVSGLARERKPVVAWTAWGIAAVSVTVWCFLRRSIYVGLGCVALVLVVIAVHVAVLRHQRRVVT